MSKWGSVDYKQFKDLQKRLEKLAKADLEKFCEETSKELAARLLGKVIPRTPVGQYPASSGKVGGTLRRGWTSGKDQNASAYAKSLPVQKSGDGYTITIKNPVNYGSFVEYGHRTRGGGGWVEGQFFLTKSEMEVERDLPKIIERKLLKYFGDIFNGK